MLKVLLYALPIILAIYALVDLVQTPEENVQGLPKLAWVALIVLIWIVGPLAWLIAGKRGRRSFLPRLSPRAAGGPGSPPARPVAPDDDPDFLRGLGRSTPPPPPPPAAPPAPPRADADDEPGDDPPLTAR